MAGTLKALVDECVKVEYDYVTFRVGNAWKLLATSHADSFAERFKDLLMRFGGIVADHAISIINPPPNGIALIYFERQRQRMEYDDAHDDGHASGELAHAAAYLANVGDVRRRPGWAVRLEAKHGGDRIKQLAIAGALIAAEIERLQRASASAAAPRKKEGEQ